MTKERLVSLGKIVVGNVFMAFAYAKWMKPNTIINGGVTSLAMILEKITKLSLLYLTNGVTLVLLASCYVFLGKGNFWRSLVSSVCYMILFSLFYSLPFEVRVNLPVDFVFASLFIAIGYYCCISSDASTVGMDVIALAIHKRSPQVRVAIAIRYINFLVLGMGLLTYGWLAVGVGIAFSFLNSYILNVLLLAHEKGSLL